MIDPSTALAFSVFENKGVYALLLGSGLSRAAQIPTGWEITLDLIRRVAELEGVAGVAGESDWAAWHRLRTGKEANYSDVLDELTTLPDERRSILHSYIDPTADDIRDKRKVPTKAHHAIAWLVREGFIKVIITTNFDRLLESALREAGVEPTVIRSDDDLRGAVPLAHSRCFVLKLHGDYLDTRIKNTDEELGAYSETMNSLLDRILDDDGLIVCGWSGDWDHALRAAIMRAPNRRFPTFWAAHGPVSAPADDLIQQRAAQVIPIADADSFFTDLQQKVAAQVDTQRPNPRSTELLVATTKRYLGRSEFRIQLNDLLAEEIRRLDNRLGEADFNRQTRASPGEYRHRVARYEAATEPLARIFGIIGRWGDEAAHNLAVELLGNLAYVKIEGGLDLWLELRFYPATLLFYAYGLGALKAGDYGLLFRWFAQMVRREQQKAVPVIVRLGWWQETTWNSWKMLEGLAGKKTPFSNHLHDITPALSRDYLLSERDHTLLFETFEVLGALAFLTFRATKERLQEALAREAAGNYIWSPVGRAGWDDVTRDLILSDLEQPGMREAVLTAGFSGGDEAHLILALESIRRLMGHMEWSF